MREDGLELLPDALPLMHRSMLLKGSYNTDEIKESLLPSRGLTDDASIKAFRNRFDWLSAEMTRLGLHTGGGKIYKLSDKMLNVAETAAAQLKSTMRLVA
jgi:hypothetical protein